MIGITMDNWARTIVPTVNSRALVCQNQLFVMLLASVDKKYYTSFTTCIVNLLLSEVLLLLPDH